MAEKPTQTSGLIPGNTTPVFSRSIGQSAEGREIRLHSTGIGCSGGTLLIAGIHGDEKGTVAVLESFLERHVRCGTKAVPAAPVYVISLANPDGFICNSRYNAHGVDLNRNFETNWSAQSEEPSGLGPWSEPESRALRDLILQLRPARIVSLHWALAEIDADGLQSTALARAMWEALTEDERAPYRMRVWEDAPSSGFTKDLCPGSLGQWCGYGLRFPDGSAPAMVTLELPYDPRLPRPEVLPDDHLATLRKAWDADSALYMADLEGPVHKMLIAACSG
ncbi:MAG: M14 family zinc carboxypeptidase [Verrucomicrobiota bacterium]